MSNTKRERSCADLIASELSDREQQLKDLYTLADDGNDDAREEIYEMAYGNGGSSVDTTGVIT
jgi:hypothetical protein